MQQLKPQIASILGFRTVRRTSDELYVKGDRTNQERRMLVAVAVAVVGTDPELQKGRSLILVSLIEKIVRSPTLFRARVAGPGARHRDIRRMR